MTSRVVVGIGVLALVQGISSGCSGAASPLPLSPSPVASTEPAVPQRPSGYALGYLLNAVGLTGVVFEITAAGRLPLDGVSVYCDACGEVGHSWVTTDRNGEYRFSGDVAAGGGIWLSGALTPLHVTKEGFGDPPGLPGLTMGVRDPAGWREVRVAGDTSFDIELVRR